MIKNIFPQFSSEGTSLVDINELRKTSSLRLEIYSQASGNLLGYQKIDTPEDVESLPETDIQSTFLIQNPKGKISGKYYLVILNNRIKHMEPSNTDELAVTNTASQNLGNSSSMNTSTKHKLDQILDIKQTPMKTSAKTDKASTQMRTSKPYYNQSYSRSSSKNSQKKNTRALSSVSLAKALLL